MTNQNRLQQSTKSRANAFLSLHLDVRRVTGFAAIAIALLMLIEFIIKTTMGTRPSLGDSAGLVDFITRHSTEILIVVVVDTFLMAFLIIFFAGLRQIVIQSSQRLSWVADIAFGAGLVFVSTTLIGDSMDGGTALDTVGRYAGDPSVLRALTEGHMLLFGSIGCVLIALITSAFSYAMFASGAAPKWTVWVGYGVAALSLLSIPAVFGGTEASAFFSEGGTAVTLLSTFPLLVWVIIVGIVTIRGQKDRNIAK